VGILTLGQLGPFVDSLHPRIKSGDVVRTPEQIFANYFAKIITDLLAEKPTMSFFIVPSINETLSEHASFPQSELDASLLSHGVRVGQTPGFFNTELG
jgi:DNA polymerase alpha subunit B